MVRPLFQMEMAVFPNHHFDSNRSRRIFAATTISSTIASPLYETLAKRAKNGFSKRAAVLTVGDAQSVQRRRRGHLETENIGQQKSLLWKLPLPLKNRRILLRRGGLGP